jgi:hypothetical protein
MVLPSISGGRACDDPFSNVKDPSRGHGDLRSVQCMEVDVAQPAPLAPSPKSKNVSPGRDRHYRAVQTCDLMRPSLPEKLGTHHIVGDPNGSPVDHQVDRTVVIERNLLKRNAERLIVGIQPQPHTVVDEPQWLFLRVRAVGENEWGLRAGPPAESLRAGPPAESI